MVLVVCAEGCECICAVVAAEVVVNLSVSVEDVSPLSGPHGFGSCRAGAPGLRVSDTVNNRPSSAGAVP